MEITEELKAKALACNTAEDLLDLAKENGIDLSPEEAELILQQSAEMPEGELADEELEDVAGGGRCRGRDAYDLVKFKSREEVAYIFNVGDVREKFNDPLGWRTVTVRIEERDVRQVSDGWYDEYRVVNISDPRDRGLFGRDMFEK